MSEHLRPTGRRPSRPSRRRHHFSARDLVHAAAVAALAGLASAAAALPLYDVSELPGDPRLVVTPHGLNRHGVVTGEARRPDRPHDWQGLAYVVSARGAVRRHQDAPGEGSTGNAINADGVVAGTEGLTLFGEKRAFLWSRSGVVHLPGAATAVGITDTGLVAGDFTWSQSVYRHDMATGAIEVLPPPAGFEYLYAAGVNARGDVLATASPVGHSGSKHVMVNSPARGWLDLGTLGASSAWGNAINDDGTICGAMSLPSSGFSMQAFVVKGGVVHPIGPGGDGAWSQLYAINRAGVSVGVMRIPDNGSPDHAIAVDVDGTTWADLNTRLAPGSEGWFLSDVRAINDRGQIVGIGIRDGVSAQVLLTPHAGTDAVR